jgi:hypothetical protein
MPTRSLPGSITDLLARFRGCLTAPTFAMFCGLACGFWAQPGLHTVWGMLAGARLQHAWHHSRAHRFFAAARWSADQLGLACSAQRAHPSRAATAVGGAAPAAVLRPATGAGLGPAAGRRGLPGLDLDQVPAVARPWSKPRPAPPAHPPRPRQAAAAGPASRTTCGRGIAPSSRPKQARVL